MELFLKRTNVFNVYIFEHAYYDVYVFISVYNIYIIITYLDTHRVISRLI